jgi:hypothetical protein
VSLQISDSIAPATSHRGQHFASILLCFLIAACSSAGYDDDDARTPPRSVTPDDSISAQGAAGTLLPPSDWWRQAELADRVKPTADQVSALDKLQTEQGDELTKLERDTVVAERDLRAALESEKPTTEEIMAAGGRVRTMRDDIFGRQLRMLAAERAILTREQWSALQDAIRMRRRDRMRDLGGRGPGGGRGAYPGRGGRRPGGFPGW